MAWPAEQRQEGSAHFARRVTSASPHYDSHFGRRLTIRDCRPSLAMAHILCSRFAYFFAAYPMLLMMYTYKVVTLSEKRKYFRQYVDDRFKTSSTKRMFNFGNLCTIHALWP